MVLVGAGGMASAAPLTQQTSTTFSGGANVQSVQDGPGSGATDSVATGRLTDFPSIHLDQFDTANGVLIGVELRLSSTRTQSGTVTSVFGASGSGRSVATSFTAPGAGVTFGNLANGGSCPMNGCPTVVAPSSTPTNVLLAVHPSALGAYAGTGTVAAARSTTLQAFVQLEGPNFGSGSYRYTLDWNGSLTATYRYLAHSDAAFDLTGSNQLVLDFGTLQQGESADPLDFDLHNLAAVPGSTAALDLDLIFGSGHTGVLATDLASFADLAAGARDGFRAFFDTSTIGQFAAQYTLLLSDANTGVGQRHEQLTLTLRGEVVAPSQVPEPATTALMGLGFAGVIAMRRRRAA